MTIFSLLYFFNICFIPTVFKSYGIAEIICLVIWFGNHLWMKREKLNSKDCMKLDLYSTIAIVALTFVWVIYDISSFKLFFGIILVVFMLVQVKIKLLQIDDISE